jgi:opacity protein-like surface antigen
MMKKILMALVATIGLTYAGGTVVPVDNSVTQEKFYTPYVGMYGAVQSSDNTGAGGLQAGVDIGKYAAVEFRADTDYNNFYNYSLLGKGKYPVGEYTPYVLVGYSTAYIKTDRVQDGLALGAGVSYTLTDNVEVFADFVQYQSNAIDDDLVDDYSTNIGLTYKF